MTSIKSLPIALIEMHILCRLNTEDIINTVLALRLPVSRGLYNMVFKDNTCFDEYNLEMFKERLDARLWVFGDPFSKNATFPTTLKKYYETIFPEDTRRRRMHSPCKVKCGNKVIVRVALGVGSLQILNEKGEIYKCDMYSKIPMTCEPPPYSQLVKFEGRQVPKPDESDFETDSESNSPSQSSSDSEMDIDYAPSDDNGSEDSAVGELIDGGSSQDFEEDMAADLVYLQADTREMQSIRAEEEDKMEDRSSDNSSVQDDDIDVSDSDESHATDSDTESMKDYLQRTKVIRRVARRMCRMPYEPTRFVDVYSNCTIFAEDKDHLFWYQAPFSMTRPMPMLLFDSESKNAITEKFEKLRLEAGNSAVLSRERGIMVFNSFSGTLPNSYKGGYPCHKGEFGCLESKPIPETAGVVRDYALGSNVALWIKNDGTVGGMNVDGFMDTETAETAEPSEEIKGMDDLNALGPFRALDSYFSSFAFVTTDGRVVVVDEDEIEEDTKRSILNSEEVKGFENVPIVSVAVGSSHFLALDREGDVYSWGVENGWNGCMGLGTFWDTMRVDEAANPHSKYLILEKPMRLLLPGRAYGVFATKDFSGVLINGKAPWERGSSVYHCQREYAYRQRHT